MKNLKLLKKLSITTLFAAAFLVASSQTRADYKVKTADKNLEVMSSTSHEFKGNTIVAGIIKDKKTGAYTLELFSKNSKGETVDRYTKRGCKLFVTAKATSGLAIEIHCVEKSRFNSKADDTNVYELSLIENGKGELKFSRTEKFLANRTRSAPVMMAAEDFR